MKRTAAAAFILFAVAATVSAEETQRYLVATRQPFHAGAVASALREARGEITLRDVAGFESFQGFAADLTPSEVARLRRSGGVRWIEPVIERHAFARPMRAVGRQTLPYGLDLIHARQAWAATRNETINVVVIDSGVDYKHPELAPIWAGGRNFVVVPNTDDAMDDAGHGTHVAGTIAAANNDAGVVGVSPDVRLWGAKVLNSRGTGSTENVIKAVDWIVEKKQAAGGKWIANLSLGSNKSSTAEREAFRRGAEAGILFVAATGNDSQPGIPAPVSFPAGYESVVAVGAIDSDKRIAEFSNQGVEVTVVAPGVDVLSTLPVATGNIAWVEAGSSRLEAAGLTGAKQGTVTAPYVFCELGKPDQIPASVAGKIALIKRGEIRFTEKAKNAMTAGAVGVAIFNHDDSPMNWTLWPDDDPVALTIQWPVVVGIAKADGEKLVAAGSGTLTLVHNADDYGYNNGTSMASPHVAAAAALVWAAAPSATAADVASALAATAADLGAPGKDTVYGSGLVNALAAIQRLNPAAIDPNNPPPSSRPNTGRRILKRGCSGNC